MHVRALRWVFLAVLALIVPLLVGCDGTHLAGTHDVELEYEVEGAAAPAAVSAVAARLAAAQVPADVVADGARVRVTVDADATATTEEMLAWRGGLALYEADPAYAFAPKDAMGLTAKTAALADGAVERYFVGPRAALLRAVSAGDVDARHRVLVEPVDDANARTRVVKEPAAIELRDVVDLTRDVASEKRDLVLYVRDAPALRARIAALGRAPTVLALGRSVMSKRPLGDLLVDGRGRPPRAAIVIPMGSTIYAYSRAHSVKSLLASGALPALTRVAQRTLAPDGVVATTCILLPIVLSFAWLFFVRRFDRARPEPWWLVLVTFALGGASVVPAGFLEWAAMTATPYLNPSLMTFGGQISAFPLALATFTLVVGLSEEGSKLLGAWSLAAHRREFDEPVDGIVYGAVSSLGFAAVENMKYFAFGRLSASIVLARTFTSIPAHMFFGAIWGYALGKRLVSKKTSVLLFLAWAALMHGAFDTLLSIDGLQLAAMGLNLVLASLFIVLLRRALRHGAIAPGRRTEAPPSIQRAFFAVGHPGAFAAAALGLHVFAFALMAYGIGHQAMHEKISYAFLAISSSLVALCGFCAYALAATMPLDVAVDDEGVTFAGRLVAWRAVRGAQLAPFGAGRAFVRLQTDGEVVRLGPAPVDRMQSLERVIRAKMGA